MAEYKLTYFGVRARAEPMRMCFAAAGIKFEDVRVDFKDWPTVKETTPFGQLPMLEYKGKKYGESAAVASFVARQCGMAGKTSEDGMRVDEVFCLTSSLLEAMAKYSFAKDDAVKSEVLKTLTTETFPKYMGFFEKMITENGGKGYIVGSALTLADLTVHDITETILKMVPTVLDNFPGIQNSRKNVEANDKLKAYLAARPAVEY